MLHNPKWLGPGDNCRRATPSTTCCRTSSPASARSPTCRPRTSRRAAVPALFHACIIHVDCMLAHTCRAFLPSTIKVVHNPPCMYRLQSIPPSAHPACMPALALAATTTYSRASYSVALSKEGFLRTSIRYAMGEVTVRAGHHAHAAGLHRQGEARGQPGGEAGAALPGSFRACTVAQPGLLPHAGGGFKPAASPASSHCSPASSYLPSMARGALAAWRYTVVLYTLHVIDLLFCMVSLLWGCTLVPVRALFKYGVIPGKLRAE